jgi:pyruvate kinase
MWRISTGEAFQNILYDLYFRYPLNFVCGKIRFSGNIKEFFMERMARTGIVATLGPSSSEYSVLRKMLLAGMNIARFNFSHGNWKQHEDRLKILRTLNRRYRRHIRFLQDLEGFRIRVGRFKGKKKKELKKNSTVRLVPGKDSGEEKEIPFDYKGDLADIKEGTLIYIDDGNIILKAKKARGGKIPAKVIEGGILKERKGINMPSVDIPFSSITEKDKKDIRFGIENKMDYMAQSFVRSAEDIRTVKDLVTPEHPECKIVAKIESREAINNIDEIIREADAIMVARGDMGIAVPIYEIAVIQKQIIKKCNRQNKKVITATEMLEHMTEHSRPTRAEVTDVSNAILDGTDFVMLSAETAVGKYPVGAVKMMDLIIKFTETYQKQGGEDRGIVAC